MFEYYPTEIPAILEEEANSYLEGVADKLDEKVVISSNPSDAILQTAERHDANLVVMAATGKGLAGRIALGSTTDRILHSLHRPLLIVPTGDSN